MNFLQNMNLNQLADYIFVCGTVVFFVMFLGVIGSIGRIKRNVTKIRKTEQLNQEILLSQITILKQIRDSNHK